MKPDYIKVTKTTVILDTDTAELKSQCKSSLLDSYIFGNCPKFSLGKKAVKVHLAATIFLSGQGPQT